MKAALVKPVRCAIYTRVSTDQGLDQEFNSLDAQYDASSAYIRSQAHAVNAPGMAPLNKAASAGESLVRQERDFWMRRPGPRNRRKRQRTSAETKTAQNR